MFEISQYSGVVLCYGPLALIIIGFIAFAILTDSNARSTYLRRMAGKSATNAPVNTVTPSGLKVTIKPEAVVESAPPAAPVKAAAAPDDLRRIEGIGPKMNSILNQAGITTFSQLAAAEVPFLRQILADAGMTAVNDPATWPEQAALAARGEWEALEELQEDLKGGRRA